ncbi:MAG TPA: biotin--[acetyl-CoA-carboxylase] ligase [Actinomycetota bacterium]|nr:biotin--[acetyl-CoA-carboxylase] ligase [Actinomycetota bacterium]
MRFDEVTRSTQVTAVELAENGAPAWTLVGAAHQTEGRGRLGRDWLDEPGALLFSVIARPEIAPDRGGLVTLLAGLAMAEALRGATATEVRCKWPNDLVVDDAKVGGILASARTSRDVLDYVVLGVGVNLGGAPGVSGAAALSDAEPADVLGAFLEAFAKDLQPSRAAFARDVIGRYRTVCATIGRRVRATTTDGALVEGEALDVDDAGGLIVRMDAGLRTVRFGDVEHVRDGALPGAGGPG